MGLCITLEFYHKKKIYMMGKALSGKLSCRVTGLVLILSPEMYFVICH